MNKFNDFTNIVQKGKDTTFDIFDIPDGDCLKNTAFQILSEDDDNLKPFSIINIESIENKKNFDLFLSHLINHDGRIREAVSFVLADIECDEEFLSFFDENSVRIIIEGLYDINPNVVRYVIEFIKNSNRLKESFLPLIIKGIEEVLEELSKYRDVRFKNNKELSNKNHAKNKSTFNLYWLLEALSNFELKSDEKLENILTKTSNFLDYTIREKTAQVLAKMDDAPRELLRKLKNDVNIYVKNQLL